MMLLEQSLLKVPVEVMRKGHRLATKTVEKDVSSAESSLKKAKNRSQSRSEKLKAVEGALAKLRGVHAKVSWNKAPPLR
jgi:hypothetical protein